MLEWFPNLIRGLIQRAWLNRDPGHDWLSLCLTVGMVLFPGMPDLMSHLTTFYLWMVTVMSQKRPMVVHCLSFWMFIYTGLKFRKTSIFQLWLHKPSTLGKLYCTPIRFSHEVSTATEYCLFRNVLRFLKSERCSNLPWLFLTNSRSTTFATINSAFPHCSNDPYYWPRIWKFPIWTAPSSCSLPVAVASNADGFFLSYCAIRNEQILWFVNLLLNGKFDWMLRKGLGNQWVFSIIIHIRRRSHKYHAVSRVTYIVLPVNWYWIGFPSKVDCKSSPVVILRSEIYVMRNINDYRAEKTSDRFALFNWTEYGRVLPDKCGGLNVSHQK